MPRGVKGVADPALLQAALEGLEAQKQRLEEQILQVRLMLGKKSARQRNESEAPKAAKRPPLSVSARKRIAAAQKRRWEQYRKNGSTGESK